MGFNGCLAEMSLGLSQTGGYANQLCLRRTNKLPLLADEYCLPHSGHNDLEYAGQSNLGFIFLLTGAEVLSLWVFC